MASVDALCKRFGIRHPLDQVTCIGYGQRKPTCGNLVAESSRLQAASMLDLISRDVQHGSKVTEYSLSVLAGLLLCKRWHQTQAYENSQCWKVRLGEISNNAVQYGHAAVPCSPVPYPSIQPPYPSTQLAYSAAQLPYTSMQLPYLPTQPPYSSAQLPTHVPMQLPYYPTQHPYSSTQLPQASPQLHATQQELTQQRPQQSTHQTRLQSCSTQELISEIRSRLTSFTNAQLLAAIREIANAQNQSGPEVRNVSTTHHQENRADTLGSNSNVQTNPPRSPALTQPPAQSTRRPPLELEPEPRRPASLSSSTAVDTTAARAQSSTRRPTPTSEDVRQARLAALAPAPRPPTPELPAGPLSPLRSSHEECCVCTLPYTEGEDNQWECQSCLNRVHLDCFESWRTQQLPGRVRCMHCRVEVP